MGSNYLNVSSTLVCLSWNCNCIMSKIHELRNFLTRHPYVDIILLQEIRNPNFNCNISGYTLYNTPRANLSRYGGTAIYIKKNIPHHLLPNYNFTNIDSTGISLDFPNISFKVFSVYVAPGRQFPVNNFSQLIQNNDKFFLCGDLNAKNRNWNNRYNNSYGNSLHRIVNHFQLSLHAPPTPTCFAHNSRYGSIIDLGLSKNIPHSITASTVNALSSDHIPVLFKIDILNPITATPSKAINWLQFQNYLENNPLPFPTVNNSVDLDLATEKLTNHINKATDHATFSFFKNNHSFIPPPYIRQLIRNRNNIRRNFQFIRDPHLKTELNRLNRKIKAAFQNETQKSWNSFLKTITPEDNSIWILKKKLNKNFTVIPPLTSQGQTAYTDKQKADMLARTYALQFTANPPDNSINAHVNQIEDTVRDYLNSPITGDPIQIQPFTIQKIINKLQVKKAPGCDNIRNKTLKNLNPNCIKYITKLANNIFKFNHFPSPWKTSIISPIPKPGTDLTIPSNYRPISLLPSISKVIERVIKMHLNHFIEQNSILMSEQFGFRYQHATTHQLLRVTEFFSEKLEARTPVAAILLDIAKAFDKVWHEALIYKLIRRKFPARLIHLIHSYLRNRLFKVKLNSTFSITLNILSGILQGSCLGPVLFNIFFSDIPRSPYSNIASYADDTAFYAAALHIYTLFRYLQEHLNLFTHWCTLWRVKINENKTVAIYFSRNFKNPQRLIINNTTIEWSNEAKYLGVTLDRRLTWRKHISQTRGKAVGASKHLNSLFRNHHFNIQNKLLLYNTCILPIITYACQIWSFASKTNIDNLSRLHNKNLRIIRGAHKYMRNTTIRRDLNTTTLRKRIKNLSQTFFENINNINNDIFLEIPDYTASEAEHRKRPRYSLILPDS